MIELATLQLMGQEGKGFKTDEVEEHNTHGGVVGAIVEGRYFALLLAMFPNGL